MDNGRNYIAVVAHYSPEGKLTPRSIEWFDGRVYKVNKVFDVRPMASLKTRGFGIRYDVLIGRSRVYLFYEDSHWWVERME